MKAYEPIQVIQIEADVVLMPNFPFDKIGNITACISYPLVSEELGAASVLIIKNFKSIKIFNSKVEELVKNSPEHSDMTILGQISRENPKLISILPTIPSYCEAPLPSLTEIYFRMSAHFTFFEGVFDAATWGMYFFGTDPRNARGIKKIGSSFKTHSLNPAEFKIIKDRLGKIYGSKKKIENFTIYNLHIHSKNRWIFNPKLQIYVIFMYQIFHYLRIKFLFSSKIFLVLLFKKIYKYVKSNNKTFLN
jgi:hypothetical protein